MNFIELKCGKSVEGEEIISYKTDFKANKYIYLLAGTHGDEVEGVFVLKQLFDWIKENDDLDLPLVVVPVLNVDGYRANTRVNAHGVDLNRNNPTDCWSSVSTEKKYFPGPSAGSEPETQYLIKLFSKYPPAFVLSFHSWKPILNYNGNCKDVAEFLANFNGYPITDDISYPTPGSMGEYGPKKAHTPVLTFECPPITDTLTLKAIWEENRKGLCELMKSETIKRFLN